MAEPLFAREGSPAPEPLSARQGSPAAESLVVWLPRAAGFGPFFAAETHVEAPARAPWRSFTQVVGEELDAHVHLVRNKLANANSRRPEEIELRVAASVAHLGLAARLLSPAFGVAILGGGFPALENAWWQPEHGGAFPLSLAEGELAGFPDVAVSQLNDGFGRFHVAPAILEGNIASALNGAAAAVSRAGLTAASADPLAPRPGAAPAARRLLATLLDDPALAGGARFRRRSCCLIYRAAPRGRGGLCGDCVLSRLPGR